MASVSPLFAINNKHAFTGDNWQKHPVLVGKYNDQKLFEFAMPTDTTFKFGRSWFEEPNHTFMHDGESINFVTLSGFDNHTLSAYVASADNINNKSVVFTIHKNSAANGWPLNYLGTEKREVIADCDDKVRTMTMSREDNRVFKHQPTRKDSYTFQVIWPKTLTRAMTLVNTEAPETQECADPPQTLENDQTIDYAPPPPESEKPPPVGGAASAGQNKSDQTIPVDPEKEKLQQKVGKANKAYITPIKVWVQDDRFVDAYKCDKVDKNGKPINGFVLTNFLEEKYAVWKREHLELDALYNKICETHNKIPLVIIAQINKDKKKTATSKRNAENAKIRKEEANRLRQVEKTQKRVEAKKQKQQQEKDNDRSEPEAEDDSQPRKKVRRGRRVNDSDSD